MDDVTIDQIFQAYGEALYLAQSMEMGMRIFYYLDKELPAMPPGKKPRIDFDQELPPDINTNSLGGFIRQFRKELLEEGAVDTQMRTLMRKLEQAAEDRNDLVHIYWWQRAPLLHTQEGRAEILAELRTLISQYRGYDEIIRRLVLLILEHFGLLPDEFQSARLQGYIQGGNLRMAWVS